MENGKLGNWETHHMENAPLPISYFSHCHPPKETGKLRGYVQERGKPGNGPPPSQYLKSTCFCCCFNLIMQSTLEVFSLFVV